MNLTNLGLLIKKMYGSNSNFSKTTGISNSTLNDFLNGKTNLGHNKFHIILNHLNLNLEKAINTKLSDNRNSYNSVGKDFTFVLSKLDKITQRMIIKTLEKEIKLEFANGIDSKLEQSLNNINKYYFDGR